MGGRRDHYHRDGNGVEAGTFAFDFRDWRTSASGHLTAKNAYLPTADVLPRARTEAAIACR